jgi:hypothetical protein
MYKPKGLNLKAQVRAANAIRSLWQVRGPRIVNRAIREAVWHLRILRYGTKVGRGAWPAN